VAGEGKRKDSDARRLQETGVDTVQVVIDYVRQETVEPLKGVGRFLIFGVAGSALLALGLVLLLVAVLRALQTETGTFHGNLSWVPYVIVAVLGIILIALAAWRVSSGPARPSAASRKHKEAADGGRDEWEAHLARRPRGCVLPGDRRDRGDRPGTPPQVAVIAGAAVMVVLTLTYLAGRRRGRRRSAVVEIRRV